MKRKLREQQTISPNISSYKGINLKYHKKLFKAKQNLNKSKTKQYVQTIGKILENENMFIINISICIS